MGQSLSRRQVLLNAAAGFAALALPYPVAAFEGALQRAALTGTGSDTDEVRLDKWLRTLSDERSAMQRTMFGKQVVRVGELAVGTPYEAFTLEAYLRAGGSPTATEPLTLSLNRFDCVSLVESCIAVARVAEAGSSVGGTWSRYAQEMERMRYRGGMRTVYASRLHYFSEWISDGVRRGLLRDVGAELGGVEDARPLRFMTEHRKSYPALTDDTVFRGIGDMEERLDHSPRRIIPTQRIPGVADSIMSGDVLAFATAIPGLDVTHSALAYRGADKVLRVLHAPLSGGAVEITKATLHQYVSAIKRGTGILVARPVHR